MFLGESTGPSVELDPSACVIRFPSHYGQIATAPLSRIPVFVSEERRSRTLEEVLQDAMGILRQDGILGD